MAKPLIENGYRLISTGHDAPILERFDYRPYREQVYKRTPQGDLKASLYFPYDWTPSDKRPGALFFFGGGWRTGTRHQFARPCAYLAARGMVAVSVDYRVVEYHGTGMQECVEDAVSAVRWLRSGASSMGIDEERIAVGGESAGGQLAAVTAIVDGFDADGEDPSVSARPDTLLLFNPGIGLMRGEEGKKLGVSASLADRISIVDNLGDSLPPTWIWFGKKDVYLQPARPFIERAEHLAHPFKLMLVDSADHGYFNDYAEFFQPAMEGMGTFLESIHYLPPE